MKYTVLIILASSAAMCDAIAFDEGNRHFPHFGVRRSTKSDLEKATEVIEKKPYKFGISSAKKEPNKDVKEVKEEIRDDFEVAEKSIFDAMERCEKAVEHAIEDEVDCFFHETCHDNDDETKKASLVSDKPSKPKRSPFHFSDDMVECLQDCLNGPYE